MSCKNYGLLWYMYLHSEGSATARLGVRDFEIHWISRGFRISEWISGFQSGFLDFKRISGFSLNGCYSEDTAKSILRAR